MSTVDGPDALERFGLHVSRESRERLAIFVGLLRSWQAVKNLVGPATLEAVWTRHIADSWQLAELAPLDGRWVDLGSGAGFPGIVIAIAMGEAPRPGVVHLIESNQRKAAFLREAVRRTGVSASVYAERAEAVLPRLGKIDVVTARAFAPLDTLLDYALPLVEKGAVALLPKGQDVEVELTEASRYWKFELERVPSRTNPSATILRVTQIARRT